MRCAIGMSSVLLILLLSGCGSLPTKSSGASAWVAGDKVAHFFFSAVISGMIGSKLQNNGWKPCQAMTGAFASTLLLGATKEVRDSYQPGNYFSISDMAANSTGALMGSSASSRCF